MRPKTDSLPFHSKYFAQKKFSPSLISLLLDPPPPRHLHSAATHDNTTTTTPNCCWRLLLLPPPPLTTTPPPRLIPTFRCCLLSTPPPRHHHSPVVAAATTTPHLVVTSPQDEDTVAQEKLLMSKSEGAVNAIASKNIFRFVWGSDGDLEISIKGSASQIDSDNLDDQEFDDRQLAKVKKSEAFSVERERQNQQVSAF